MLIEVYTDGSATVSDRPGGWAYVLILDGGKFAECSGHMSGATNNDAEMQAAIEGLSAVYELLQTNGEIYKFPEVVLVSDSQLVLGWASGTYKFKQQEKIEKFHKLQSLVHKLRVKTRWIKGHSGDEHNERCDKLANEARLGVENKKDRKEAKERGETLIGTKKSGTVAVWYRGNLKIIDLETNVIENYDRDVHGPRGSMLEIKEEKSR
jgi:ribonuclease HI